MAWAAHIALQNHHILPSVFNQMSIREKAFFMASENIAKEERDKLKKKVV